MLIDAYQMRFEHVVRKGSPFVSVEGRCLERVMGMMAWRAQLEVGPGNSDVSRWMEPGGLPVAQEDYGEEAVG